MGTSLIKYYRETISKERKIAFFSAFILGLLCHFFKFTNNLPNHDSVLNYYDPQNIVGTGRWLLSVSCFFSSFYDLPWIVGLISLLFLGLTAAVIVQLFKIKNPVAITLVSGLLVTSISTTAIFHFEYTADGYMIAMFLSALVVLLSQIGDCKKGHWILSALFVCCSCGIYQAFLSFSLVLMAVYCVWCLFVTDYKLKDYVLWIVREIIIVAAGLALYYVIWKLCLHFEHISATSYHGVDSLGLSLSTVLQAIPESVSTVLLYFFEWNVFKHNLTVYGGLNLIFLGIFLLTIVAIVLKNKLYKKIWKLILLLLCFGAVPFFASIWIFSSDSAGYSPRMLSSLSLLYIFLAVIADRMTKVKWSNIIALVLAAIIFNNCVVANVSYCLLQQEYEASYATCSEMVARIHLLNSDAKNIAVIGGGWDIKKAIDTSKRHGTAQYLANEIEENLMFDHDRITGFLINTLDSDYQPISKDVRYKLGQNEEVKKMGIWPASDSVRVIDDTIVIKLSESNQYNEP